MAEAIKKREEPSSTTEAQPEATSSKQQTPYAKVKKLTPTELKEPGNERIQKVYMKVRSTLQQRGAEPRGGKKPMILVVCYYRPRKNYEEKPVEEEEESQEESPSTSNSEGLSEAEDTHNGEKPVEEEEESKEDSPGTNNSEELSKAEDTDVSVASSEQELQKWWSI